MVGWWYTASRGLIQMQNIIIAADGTRYIEEGTVRRQRRRMIKIIASLIAAPFLIAALVGIGMAATGNAPSSTACTR